MANSSTRVMSKMMKFLSRNNFNGFCRVFDKINVIGGGEGHCICEVKIEERHRNRGGTLHGGMTATLVDIVAATAVQSINIQDNHGREIKEDSYTNSVAQNLDITYIKAASVGDLVVIEAKTIGNQDDIIVLSVDVKNKRTGAVVANALHTRLIQNS